MSDRVPPSVLRGDPPGRPARCRPAARRALARPQARRARGHAGVIVSGGGRRRRVVVPVSFDVELAERARDRSRTRGIAARHRPRSPHVAGGDARRFSAGRSHRIARPRRRPPPWRTRHVAARRTGCVPRRAGRRARASGRRRRLTPATPRGSPTWRSDPRVRCSPRCTQELSDTHPARARGAPPGGHVGRRLGSTHRIDRRTGRLRTGGVGRGVARGARARVAGRPTPERSVHRRRHGPVPGGRISSVAMWWPPSKRRRANCARRVKAGCQRPWGRPS